MLTSKQSWTMFRLWTFFSWMTLCFYFSEQHVKQEHFLLAREQQRYIGQWAQLQSRRNTQPHPRAVENYTREHGNYLWSPGHRIRPTDSAACGGVWLDLVSGFKVSYSSECKPVSVTSSLSHMNTLSELSSFIFRDGIFLFFIFLILYREEIEAAQTLLFGLSAGAGVSALASSSLQTLPSTTPKSSGTQSGMAPSTSQLNSKRAASESNSEGDSEEEDLGFGDSDYFHDNKYGKMRECLRAIQTHFIFYAVWDCLFRSLYFALSTNIFRTGHKNYLGSTT